MSRTVIKIEGLSKRYRLGLVGSGTLKDDIKGWWYRMRGKEDLTLKIGEENRLDTMSGNYIWALKDINLEVKEGEVLGIIGRNGAGKSTLLKILSRVTGPSTGVIRTKGRIASLLEVGTGMHPELTGRENVYLNGAILGMTKHEINAKFDEIVDFSGVARYIDTPVKRYSSGMHVRLGFAVAAFLESEILIVDEVLAVGDAEFQKKAIGKMQDVSMGKGRTVLFVSHNMTSVKSLCNRAILLETGKIILNSSPDDCIHKYLNYSKDKANSNHIKSDNPFLKLHEIEVSEMGIKAQSKSYNDPILMSDKLGFFIRINQKTNDQIHITLHLKDEHGNKIFSTGSYNSEEESRLCGLYDVKLSIPGDFFNWGNFALDLFIIKNKKYVIHIANDILSFSIVNNAMEIGSWMGKEPGPIHPKFQWAKKKIE